MNTLGQFTNQNILQFECHSLIMLLKLNARNMYFIKMMSRRVTQSMTLMTDPWQGWAEPGVWILNLIYCTQTHSQ